jgi:hypothetical protein
MSDVAIPDGHLYPINIDVDLMVAANGPDDIFCRGQPLELNTEVLELLPLGTVAAKRVHAPAGIDGKERGARFQPHSLPITVHSLRLQSEMRYLKSA